MPTSVDRRAEFDKSVPEIRKVGDNIELSKYLPGELQSYGTDHGLTLSGQFDGYDMRARVLCAMPNPDPNKRQQSDSRYRLYDIFSFRGRPPVVRVVDFDYAQGSKLKQRDALDTTNSLDKILPPELASEIQYIQHENNGADAGGSIPDRLAYEEGRKYNGALDALLPPNNLGLVQKIADETGLQYDRAQRFVDALQATRAERKTGRINNVYHSDSSSFFAHKRYQQ